MAWTKGWDLRSTSAYVTDVAPNTYLISEAYPVTRNGVTFGYTDVDGLSVRNRNSAVDPRFAGLHFANAATGPLPIQIDLPATGDYTIRLSLGDYSYATNVHVVLKDNTTAFATIASDTTAANRYRDATDVERTSPSDWITNNASITRTFASTTFNVVVGDGTASSGEVTHILIDQVSAPSAPAQAPNRNIQINYGGTFAGAGRGVFGRRQATRRRWPVPTEIENG